jgi:hypothetical protein
LDGGGKARSRNHVAFIGAATLTIFIELAAFAFAQMTVTPGPGGIPIAPGSPVAGYTPGGIGLGGVEVAPGPAARDIPTDRIGPGGVPFPPRPDPYPVRDNSAARLQPGCGNTSPCGLPQTLMLTINSRDAGRARHLRRIRRSILSTTCLQFCVPAGSLRRANMRKKACRYRSASASKERVESSLRRS